MRARNRRNKPEEYGGIALLGPGCAPIGAPGEPSVSPAGPPSSYLGRNRCRRRRCQLAGLSVASDASTERAFTASAAARNRRRKIPARKICDAPSLISRQTASGVRRQAGEIHACVGGISVARRCVIKHRRGESGAVRRAGAVLVTNGTARRRPL